MKKIKFLILYFLFPFLVIGQLTVINPGLEGPTGWGLTPDPWENCMPFGFYIYPYGYNATPDTQPGTYEITLAASEGSTYVGFGHMPNYNNINPSLGINNFQEGFSQELSSPMIANGCPYTFTIDLANGLTNDIWSSSTGITTTTAEVKVFGGFDLCSEQELLWESGPVTNENWETYIVEFTPSDNYSHILFEAFKVEEDALCGYVLADNITPIVNTTPTADAGPDQNLCEYSTYLNGNNLEEGQTGNWTIISGNGNFLDANDPNTLVTNLSVGNNIFEWSISAECTDGFGTSQVNINVIEEPSPNAGTDQEICLPQTVLNGNIVLDPATMTSLGTWSIVSGSGNIQNINDPNTLVTNLGEGDNIFQWSFSSLLCGDFNDQVTINYFISELYSNAGTDQELCEPETILNGNIPNDGENGSWSIISGSGNIQNINDPNSTVTNLGEGNNIFEWTISDPCGSSSTQVNIKVEIVEFFIDEVSNYNGYNISCKGFSDGSITVYSIGGYPPYNYNWIGPENFTNNNQNIDNLSSGLYECTIIDSLGCEKTISYTLEEPDELTVELVSIEDLNCFENAHIDFNTAGGTGTLEGNLTTSWGEITTFLFDTSEEWYFDYENFDQWDGFINLFVTDQNGCIVLLENIEVQSWSDPVATFETSTNDTTILDVIEFVDYSTTHAPIVNWFWDFGDGNTTNYQNPTHFYEQEGQYTVCLTITDLNGCESEKCKIINIYENSYAYIPDIFTVNNDNINEVFLPIISGILVESYKMFIYDRWGKLLFSTQDPKKGWDGTNNGILVNQDIYSYKILYSTLSGNEKEHLGKVTLAK